MVESTHYAYVMCYSKDGHVLATEYEEIVKWCKANGYYFAIKAEDTNPISEMGWDDKLDEYTAGKVHIHFLIVREMATFSHEVGDRRYGAVKKSHLRENFFKACPAVSSSISKSQYAQKYAFMMAQMTSDHAAVYFSKESLLKLNNLPADLVVLRPYISLKVERQWNPEDDAHQEAYKKAGYPMPATMESVWEYLTERWYKENNCRRVKRKQLQDEQCENLFYAINETKPPMSKRLKEMSEEMAACDCCGKVTQLHAVQMCGACLMQMKSDWFRMQGKAV